MGFANQTDWSLPAVLYRLEAFNGYGYRNVKPPINSPYLWSFSNQYTKGKFVADHVYDANAVSDQCGSAVILFRMKQNGNVDFASVSVPEPPPTPDPTSPMTVDQLLAQFDTKVGFSDKEASDDARSLQEALNTFPLIQLDVNGVPGRDTSDAYQAVTGHFLRNDPLHAPD
jgi:hypothetical protein